MKIYFWVSILSCLLSIGLCKVLIPLLRKLKAGQNILSYVKEHKAKNGTPTMGGLGFITAALLSAVLFVQKAERSFLIVLVIGLSYMVIGLLDDYLKQKHKENLGLRAWQKLLFQILVAIFAAIYCYKENVTFINIPFIKSRIDVGGWIFPISIFVFIATVNAVNLTDGLDGLAASSSIPFFACLGVLISVQKGFSYLSILSFCLMGALLGYLFFNTSPASVFMGDTGSLALGGFAAAIAIFTGNVLYIAVVGLVFVISVISVILQVIYYKATKGKRIFLMAPIHHHFQQKGFSESKISYAYFIITLLLGAVCVVTAM
ncbi:MAG: phospho-N-acetylmuramoyl-pentapeptide-transferase [Clostridiales bacterium]|nr:phospho-N-acetylmuramoyl-pentapeptide-transferase [Clostridiales bacterium]